MHDIPSHIYTPAGETYDDNDNPIPNVPCVACLMPAAEHLDDDVVDSYAGARRLAADSGTAVGVLLTCGHTSGHYHPASSIWDHPDDTGRCDRCGQLAAMAELSIEDGGFPPYD